MRFQAKKTVDGLFSIGFLALAVGLYLYFQPTNTQSDLTISPTLPQRELAIEQARQNGQTTYSFTTNFIPGVGTIGDPEGYQKQLEANFENQLKDR